MENFWSVKNVFTTRRLTLMALFVAMSVALAPLEIFITPQFKLLSLSFLPVAVGSMMFGPWPAILMGLATDTLGYMIRPAGPYFFGYALSAMLTNLIYALWQYGRPVKVWRIAAAQVCNTVFVYFGLNLIWQTMMFGMSAAAFFSQARLIKNAIMLPVYVFAIYTLGRFAVYLEHRLPSREKAG